MVIVMDRILHVLCTQIRSSQSNEETQQQCPYVISIMRLLSSTNPILCCRNGEGSRYIIIQIRNKLLIRYSLLHNTVYYIPLISIHHNRYMYSSVDSGIHLQRNTYLMLNIPKRIKCSIFGLILFGRFEMNLSLFDIFFLFQIAHNQIR